MRGLQRTKHGGREEGGGATQGGDGRSASPAPAMWGRREHAVGTSKQVGRTRAVEEGTFRAGYR